MDPTAIHCTCLDDYPTPITPLSRDVAVVDFDDLFHAVTERLRLMAGDDFLAVCLAQGADATGCIRIGMLECAAALEQLHASFTHEIFRGRPTDAARPRAPAGNADPGILDARFAASPHRSG